MLLPLPSLSLVAFSLTTALLIGCGKNSTVGVSTNPDVLERAQRSGDPEAAKGRETCLLPSQVLAGFEYTCADGTKRKGTLAVRTIGSAPECSQDDEKGCLTTDAFSAFAKVERAKLVPGNVKQGVVIASITGTLTSTGPADCKADGEVACVSTSMFPAAAASSLASKVLSGETVAGVAGTAPVRPADCALDGATGCVATVGFPAVNLTLLTPSVLKKSTTVAGITGDYPSSTYPLPGASGTTDLTSLASTTAAGSYEFFDSSGVRYTGAITDAGTIAVGTSAQTFNASLYRGFTVPGDANLLATNIASGVSIFGVAGSAALRPADCAADGATDCVSVAGFRAANTTGLASKVLSGQTVAGVAGNVTLPVVTDVKLNVTYGVGGTGLTGSYTGAAVADCTADGNVDCKIPATGPLKAADTTNFTGWDIRKKRNSSGTVLTFAGITSQGKSHCRNRANRSVFNNATAPAEAAGVGVGTPDFFDTIDDYNNNLTGLPGEIPAWTMVIGGSTVTVGSDFACGGIYATGDTASGNTGADASLAHDPQGNWQDLTPGIIPAATPTNSTNTNNGCNASDKHCVFRELISGLMVTEVSATSYTWQNAITYCHNLGEAGGAITNPIPVIGGASYSDWRLPTQKELMQLSNAGIRGLNQTSNLMTFFGDVDASFWSSSSVSYNASNAWSVNLYNGTTGDNGKTLTNRAVCVR
jgi:hypothetical protein